jgi:hypothetical protein
MTVERAESDITTASLLGGREGDAGLRTIGGITIEHIQDPGRHTVGIAQDVVIPETQDLIAHGFEHSSPIRFISCCMLTPVELDDQPRIRTEKISNVSVDRNLAPEFQSIEPSVSQAKPQRPLGISLVATEPPCGASVLAHGKTPASELRLKLSSSFATSTA